MKVNFSEVLTQFRFYHSGNKEHEKNTNNYAEKSLIIANELLKEWYKVSLKRKDILQVILPWHESEGGKAKLIPKTGLTVAKTVEKLRALEDSYKQESPICWNKIFTMSKVSFTPIFLVTQAINTEEYKSLDIKRGLIHLDGLHRMISWELNNLLTENVSIETYIAGPLNHLG